MNTKKWKCKLCEGYQEKGKRISKKFCSSICFEKFKIKKCKYCGEDFKCEILSQRYCRRCSESQEVDNKKGKIRYHSILSNRKCKHCGKEMLVKRHVLLCKECKDSLPNPLVHKFEDISRDVLCPKCGLKSGEEIVKQSWRTQKNKINTRLCDSCKEESNWQIDVNRVLRNIYLTQNARKYIKEKLKIINSVRREQLKEEILRLKAEENLRVALIKDEEIRVAKDQHLQMESEKAKKRLDILKIIEEKEKELLNLANGKRAEKEKLKKIIEIEKEKIRQEKLVARSFKQRKEYIRETPEENEKRMLEVSARMKNNNPMKRADVAEKVSKTFHDRIESGKITFKRGAEHWLWKGNRGFNLDCRNRLYKPWILEVLKRDKFICTMCGSKKNLHVHHIRTLRKIINIVLQKNGICAIKDVDTKSELYERLMQEVVNEHKISDGITVCVICHDEIDERYRRYKGEGKKNLQGKV